jgi:shikimate kinase
VNLVLIGYRCSGKSTVSRYLADALSWQVVHVDQEIAAKAGRRILDIVRSGGWQAFRAIEIDVISEATERDRVVIDTGGSVVVNERNMRRLRERGQIVWLRTTTAEIRARMERLDVELLPLTDAATAVDEVDTMVQRLNPLYEAAAHYVVDTDGRSGPDVADEILRCVRLRLRGQWGAPG